MGAVVLTAPAPFPFLLANSGYAIAQETPDLERYIEELPPAMAAIGQRASAGDTEAAFLVGETFLKGTGVQQNFPAAAHWFKIAAASGHPGAHNALGGLLAEGLGVDHDRALAEQHLKTSAQSGDPEHIFDLGRFYEQAFAESTNAEDAAKARDHYAAASQKGHVEAMANLGQMYLAGEAIEKDPVKARHYLEKAAEAGSAKAQNNLGLIYVRGDGVERDYERAATLFLSAAQQGLPIAKRNLGVMYENGFGVKQDDAIAAELYKQGARTGGSSIASLIEAVPFFNDPRLIPLREMRPDPGKVKLAADQGDPIAKFIYALGLFASNNAEKFPEAGGLMREAAELGLPAAMANLGILYLRGLSLPQDYVLGYVWLNRAVAGGLDEAIALRDALAARLSPEQIAEAQQLAVAK